MIVTTREQASRLIEALHNSPVAAFDTEYSGALVPVKKGQKKGRVVDAVRCRLTGLSVACAGGSVTAYVPIGHRVGENAHVSVVHGVLEALGRVPVLWAHGLKAELLSLWRYDRLLATKETSPPTYSGRMQGRLGNGLRDGAVASWLMNSERAGGHGLKKVRQTILGLPPRPSYEEVFGQTLVEDLPPEHAATYAELDAIDELELGETLWHKMDEKQRWAMDHLEMPLAGELADIARRGVPCDAEYLERLRASLAPRRAQIACDFLWWTGVEVGSDVQLGHWLFGGGRAPKHVTHPNKKGWAVDEDVLVAVKKACPEGSDGHRAASMVLEYRDCNKKESTYCEGLLRCLAASEDGRLHPQLNVIGAEGAAPRTGRFSCSAPNLQNLPRPDDDAEEGDVDEARIIRQAFRPGEGWEVTEADYKQVELCILGHLLGGKGTHADAAREGRDMHKAVADVMGVTRYEGKHLNFAVIFQCGPFTLAQRSGKTEEEAKALLNQMKAGLPEVMAMQDRCAAIAQERGFIRTMSGRRREVPELRSDRSTKAGNKLWYRGKRVAFNTPIQGGARDVVAAAMPKVSAALREAGLQARVVMQVHDSLWFEHPASERAAVHEVARRVMLAAWPGLKVPLGVDVKSGPSLGDC